MKFGMQVEIGEWWTKICMQYDLIQGQGHEPFKVGNPSSKAISSAIYNGSWQLTTDSETTAQYLNFDRAGFLIFS